MMATCLLNMHARTPLTRPPKPKPINTIEVAIKSWLQVLPPELLDGIDQALERLISSAPKRWVVYHPMALLPSGSFGEEWWEILGPEQAISPYKEALWKLILDGIGKKEGKGYPTHLAVNSGIPLLKLSEQGSDSPQDGPQRDTGNILRTPSGLIMLYGDFGPAKSPDEEPVRKDFEDAFWVSTKQNGIVQIWAPRYTMFSRGNVKEKARLLYFHKSRSSFETRRVGRQELEDCVAVDLYAGIGYFVFSYVKMGMGRVFGWELNAWSVEGLRRGAVANKWDVKVVTEGEVVKHGNEQIIVFLEDNRNASKRLESLDRRRLGAVKHVNGGLLPTSEESWEMALEILSEAGWLHLHENVGVQDVETRRAEVEERFRVWLRRAHNDRAVRVEHVELVKTFAPGVWHCVFDIFVARPEPIARS